MATLCFSFFPGCFLLIGTTVLSVLPLLQDTMKIIYRRMKGLKIIGADSKEILLVTR
jgi:hypothetical protein